MSFKVETGIESGPVGLSAEIRADLHGIHDAIEGTPIARALLDGSITRREYTSLIATLLPMHRALERAQARHAPALGFLEPVGPSRAAAIERDLGSLGGWCQADPQATSASALAAHVTRAEDDSPWAVLGCLYVIEGSRMGGLVLARPLARALGVPCEPGHGLDYHLDGADEIALRLRGFKAAIDRSVGDPIARATTRAWAAETMKQLFALYSAAPPAAR